MRRWWWVLAVWACDDGGDPVAQETPVDAAIVDGAIDMAQDARVPDQAIGDMAAADMAPDAAPADMQPTDMRTDGSVADGAPLDMTPADMLPPDMTVPDMAPPDMGGPDRCARWAGVADDALVQAVHAELVATYRPVQPEPDRGGNLNRYTTARHAMFVDVERPLRGDGVECVYTGRFVATGPDAEPDHGNVNAEHVWPRSRMHEDEDGPLYEHQQSDVHHLYPSDSDANSTRGSARYGEVVGDRNLDFLPAVEGLDRNGDRVFEPRDERKGDIARAVLYFSIRWGRGVGPSEEEALRAWVVSDPVDDRERQRNDLVEQVQGNRNPFVDCPELVPRIADFADFVPGDRNLPLP